MCVCVYFFLISNGKFIANERNYSMFTMMNIMHLEEIQANQLEVLRDLKITDGSTIGRTPCWRPIKQSVRQQGLQLLDRSHALLKNVAVTLSILN